MDLRASIGMAVVRVKSCSDLQSKSFLPSLPSDVTVWNAGSFNFGRFNQIFFLFTSFITLVAIAVFLLDCLSNWMACLKAHGSRVISIKITWHN